MRYSFILMLLVACGILSGQSIPYGREFKVNLVTQNDQGYPSAVRLGGGKIAVCWESNGQDNAGYGIFGRLLDPTDLTEGPEFQIHSTGPDEQRYPGIVSRPDGGFIVFWNNKVHDGFPYGVVGRIFDPAGAPNGGEIAVDSSELYPQWLPSASVMQDGGFAVCWASDWRYDPDFGVFGQLFDGSGFKTGEKIKVNSFERYYQGGPQTAALSGGGFVACWQAWAQDGVGSVYGQVFSDTGAKNGMEFRVNATDDDQWRPSVAALADGGFIVCWQMRRLDGSGSGVYGRHFDGAGAARGGVFQVKTFTRNIQWRPSVAALPDGGFIACWQSDERSAGDYGVFGQLFDSTGAPEGGEFRITESIRNDQWGPKAASLSEDGFLIYWASQDPTGTGGDIYAKIYPGSPIVHPLSPFSLIAPGNDASLGSTGTVLIWRQPSDRIVCYPWELHYRILVDEDPDFKSPVIYEQDLDTTRSIADLQPGTTYFWIVLAKNIAGDSLWSSETNAFFVSRDPSGIETWQSSTPAFCRLFPNYPNPFNPETLIRFNMPNRGRANVEVFDLHGRLIRVLVNETRPAGEYAVRWDGLDSAGNPIPSGIYVCRMEVRTGNAERFVRSIKMGLVR